MTVIGRDFLNRIHKALTTKEKIDKPGYSKLLFYFNLFF